MFALPCWISGKFTFFDLTSESVKGAALSLEGVDNVKSGDGLAASVLSVGDGVSDNVLKEYL